MSPQMLVAALQEERGLSLSEIASHLGVSRVAVWNWQTGKSSPRPATLKKLGKMVERTSTSTNSDVGETSFTGIISEAKDLIAQALDIDPDEITVIINR